VSVSFPCLLVCYIEA